jgi:ABC-2 type transport system ATP-binding protein
MASLCKRYGTVEAVKDVSFCIERGEVFAFMGPNGAGKTTTVRMLCTLTRPGGGRACVAGFDVARQPKAVRRRIGLVFQEPTLDDRLTAEQNLRSTRCCTTSRPRRCEGPQRARAPSHP